MTIRDLMMAASKATYIQAWEPKKAKTGEEGGDNGGVAVEEGGAATIEENAHIAAKEFACVVHCLPNHVRNERLSSIVLSSLVLICLQIKKTLRILHL